MTGLLLVQVFIIGLVGASVIYRPRITNELVLKNSEHNTGLPEYITLETKTKKFDIFKTRVSWYNALVFCKERHGSLATITSQEDHDLLVKKIQYSGLGQHVWIGATELNSTRGFYWISEGEAELTYTKWFDGPLATEGSCLAYHWLIPDWTTIGWYNYDCNEQNPFACEYF